MSDRSKKRDSDKNKKNLENESKPTEVSPKLESRPTEDVSPKHVSKPKVVAPKDEEFGNQDNNKLQSAYFNIDTTPKEGAQILINSIKKGGYWPGSESEYLSQSSGNYLWIITNPNAATNRVSLRAKGPSLRSGTKNPVVDMTLWAGLNSMNSQPESGSFTYKCSWEFLELDSSSCTVHRTVYDHIQYTSENYDSAEFLKYALHYENVNFIEIVKQIVGQKQENKQQDLVEVSESITPQVEMMSPNPVQQENIITFECLEDVETSQNHLKFESNKKQNQKSTMYTSLDFQIANSYMKKLDPSVQSVYPYLNLKNTSSEVVTRESHDRLVVEKIEHKNRNTSQEINKSRSPGNDEQQRANIKSGIAFESRTTVLQDRLAQNHTSDEDYIRNRSRESRQNGQSLEINATYSSLNNIKLSQNDQKSSQNDQKSSQNVQKPSQNDKRPSQNDKRPSQNDKKPRLIDSKQSDEVFTRIEKKIVESSIEQSYVKELVVTEEVIVEEVVFEQVVEIDDTVHDYDYCHVK